jgi:hypothetical protein
MKRAPSPAFSETESQILVTLYEQPDSDHSAYTLAQVFHPAIQLATPEYQTAVGNICQATENLIVDSLVQGKRLRGDNGICFGGLKLTRTGEQAAIPERRRIAELKRLPELLDAVAAIRKKRNGDA